MDEEGRSADGKWKKEGGRERKSEKGRVGLHFSPIKYHAPDRIELVITQSGRWSLVTWRLQASALPILMLSYFCFSVPVIFSREEEPNFGNHPCLFVISNISYLDRKERIFPRVTGTTKGLHASAE